MKQALSGNWFDSSVSYNRILYCLVTRHNKLTQTSKQGQYTQQRYIKAQLIQTAASTLSQLHAINSILVVPQSIATSLARIRYYSEHHNCHKTVHLTHLHLLKYTATYCR